MAPLVLLPYVAELPSWVKVDVVLVPTVSFTRVTKG
jgi:hypothetical protein